MIVYDSFDLRSLSLLGTDYFSSSRSLALKLYFMVPSEFGKKRFDERLQLLLKARDAQLERELGSKAFIEPRTIDIPPYVLLSGLRTHLGEPRVTPDETFIPLIVDQFLAPTADMLTLYYEEKAEAK